MDLLSFIAPKVLTADVVRYSVGTCDMLANRYRTQLPDAVGIAWRETMRPALVQWADDLATQEKQS